MPFRQSRLSAQSVFVSQPPRMGQPGQSGPPQSLPVSSPFSMLSLQVGPPPVEALVLAALDALVLAALELEVPEELEEPEELDGPDALEDELDGAPPSPPPLLALALASPPAPGPAPPCPIPPPCPAPPCAVAPLALAAPDALAPP
jgi:hypothetical protein